MQITTGRELSNAIINTLSRCPVVDLTDKNMLLRKLVLNYHVMVASGELLIRANEQWGGDSAVNQYFTRHFQEEWRHAEWLADDLAAVGIDVHSTIPPMIAVEIAGSAYYSIQHISPICLFGYMLALECVPRDLLVIEKLEKLHGIPLLRTVREHAHLDVNHAAELVAQIDHHIQLYPSHMELIERQAILTCAQMTRAAGELVSAAQSINLAA